MSTERPPSLLKDPLFRRLWVTVEISFLGGFVHVVACSWLIALMSGTATLVALTQTAYSLPLVFFSIYAGALADTHDQRKTMIWALLVSIIASVLLAIAAALDLLTPWIMLTLLFAVGVGVAIFTPSWQASLSGIVERDRLGEAVSLHNMGANLMRTLGPTLGGLLMTFTSAMATFVVGGLSYVPAYVTLLLWKPTVPPVETSRESVLGAMASGVRFLFASPNLQPILARVFCFSTSAISVVALLPLIVRDQIGGDATEYGAMFGAFGLGAILGGFALRHLRTRRTSEWIVKCAFLINAAAILALSVSQNIVGGLAATVVAGGCWLSVHSLQNTTLQLATPRWMVGRMVSMFLTAAFLGLSVGSWFWGFVTEYTGTEVALGLSAGAMGGTYLLALRYPLPDTQNLTLDPLEDQTAVALPVAEVGAHTGPIQVMLEHNIAPDRLGDFQALMQLRRSHLIRLGARQWNLLKEIGQEERWVEIFQFSTWADYQRLLKRRTAETAHLRAKIQSVQCNGADPVLRRLILSTPGPRFDAVMLRT